MERILRLMIICSGCMSGGVTLLFQKLILNSIANEPGTEGYIFGIALNLLLLIACGFFVGLLHGWTFGEKSVRVVIVAASTPVFLWALFIIIATWLLAAPMIMGAIGFACCVSASIKQGGELFGSCKSQ